MIHTVSQDNATSLHTLEDMQVESSKIIIENNMVNNRGSATSKTDLDYTMTTDDIVGLFDYNDEGSDIDSYDNNSESNVITYSEYISDSVIYPPNQ